MVLYFNPLLMTIVRLIIRSAAYMSDMRFKKNDMPCGEQIFQRSWSALLVIQTVHLRYEHR